MLFKQGKLTYTKDKTITIQFDTLQDITTPDFTLQFISSDNTIHCKIHFEKIPQIPIKIEEFELLYHIESNSDTKVFCNGYQSWSHSYLISANGVMPKYSKFLGYFNKFSGDQTFPILKNVNLYSWHYSYLQSNEYKLQFYSKNDAIAFTIFDWHLYKNTLRILIDTEGMFVNNPICIADVYWDKNQITTKNLHHKNIGTWNSWYDLKHNINQKKIKENLQALTIKKIPINVFQIDDGWQTQIGDWTQTNKKFDNDFGDIIEDVKTNDMQLGLWFAPCIASKNSEIFKKNKEYFLSQATKKYNKAAYQWHWGGFVYALDTLHEGYKNYIKTTLQYWKDKGVKFFKLDFVYAACIIPHSNKTRAQLLYDFVKHIENSMNDVTILWCGIPMVSYINSKNYVRTSCDMDNDWNNRWIRKYGHRESVSSSKAIETNFLRYSYYNSKFPVDSDVFLLNDNNKLNEHQHYSVRILQYAISNIIGHSDNIDFLKASTLQWYQKSFPITAKNIEVDISKKIWLITYYANNLEYFIVFNNNNQLQNYNLPRGTYYQTQNDNFILNTKQIKLAPFETQVFLNIKNNNSIEIAGGTGHIFPGQEIKKIEIYETKINLEIDDKVMLSNMIYILLPNHQTDILINNILYKSKNIKGLNIVSYFYRT